MGKLLFGGLDDEESHCAQDGDAADNDHPQGFGCCGERPILELKEGHNGENDPGQHDQDVEPLQEDAYNTHLKFPFE